MSSSAVSFAALGLPEALADVLARQGIAEAFPIQAATLPDALGGADVCGRAPTGSGKTLAFGLPVLAGLRAADSWAKPGRPSALILLPTRELAAQVATVLGPLARAIDARVATVYGGVGFGPQRAALRKGADIVVGCPGRIEDLIAQGDLDLSDVRWAVLDEADRMCDMGFLPAVRRLLDQVGPDRQMLLFSATLDGDVDVIVRRYLDNPRRHDVVAAEEQTGDVTHRWWRTDRDHRIELVARLVHANRPTIVFCRTRHGADRLTRRLGTLGIRAAAVHGDRSQAQRERALAAFTAGRIEALIATDVAARGIHVDGVACVVHFDPPADPKDYVHRSGRTGRAGADGLVVTLVTPDVAKAVATLQKALDQPRGTTDPHVAPLPDLPPVPRDADLTARPAGRHDRRGGGGPRTDQPGGGRPGAGSSRQRRGGPGGPGGRPYEDQGGRDHARAGDRPARGGGGPGFRRNDDRPARGSGDGPGFRRNDDRPARDGDGPGFGRNGDRPARGGGGPGFRRNDDRPTRGSDGPGGHPYGSGGQHRHLRSDERGVDADGRNGSGPRRARAGEDRRDHGGAAGSGGRGPARRKGRRPA